MPSSPTPPCFSPAPPDPLTAIHSKTSFFPPQPSCWGARRRILGPRSHAASFYHVMSRTCGGAIFFDDLEKEALRLILSRLADFSGVQILTFCLMGNHFHLLLSVPHRLTWLQRFDGPEGEERLLSHLRILYSKHYIRQLQAQLQEWRRLGMESRAQAKLESFKLRMADLTRFVKELKERFSRWYNRRHDRKGTLWMDRFKSVLIEGNLGRRGERETSRIDVLKTMASYIDLNPVRAGLVKDPRHYPWCGYGQACAGERRARQGLCRVMGRPTEGWDTLQTRTAYAGLLCGVDRETGARRSGQVRKSQPQPAPEADTQIPADPLKHRVRAFSESLVIGTMDFVEEMFQSHRGHFGSKRREGARPLRIPGIPFFVARRVTETPPPR